MSRLGKIPTPLPAGTEVTVADGVIVVKGTGGELRKKLHRDVEVSVADGAVTVTPAHDGRQAQAMWGTFSSHIKNMVDGVNKPFEKKLVVEGVGYKVALNGHTLDLQVGFSHPVAIEVPEGLTVTVEKNEITITGIDKEHVGQFAADVRSVKKPEPYKGKGIRYHDEVVRRKEGKRAVA
tara:strand:+ start:20240 stop:20776 length:537 start_codon:yes stop_codon:yes gene_type:complete